MEFLSLGLVRHNLNSEESISFLDGPLEAQLKIIQKLEIGEFCDRAFILDNNTDNAIHSYLEGLKRSGLDIGEENNFGYYLSNLTSRSISRNLIIFRRKY